MISNHSQHLVKHPCDTPVKNPAVAESTHQLTAWQQQQQLTTGIID
jgi:hypothetical protein